MRIIRHLDELNAISYHAPSGIAIGTFDGIHLGHQTVIGSLIDYCKKHHLESVVYTFANHPREFTNKDALPNRILSLEDKIDYFDHLGVDELVMVEFDEEHMRMDSGEFIREILSKKLNMRYLSAGYNFRFGAGAKGNAEFLKNMGKEIGYSVQIIPPFLWEGEAVSSTRIRTMLREGRIENVNAMLGRNHTVSGQVIHGKRLGRKLGYPTANLKVSPNMTLMMPGVYATRTWIGRESHISVTNVGYNPTFSQNEFNLETYILGYNSDLYHKHITIEFLKFLRPEIRFKGVEFLVEQIEKDVEEVRLYFNSHKQKNKEINLPLSAQKYVK